MNFEQDEPLELARARNVRDALAQERALDPSMRVTG